MIERPNETIKHDFAMEIGANLRWWLIISGDMIVKFFKNSCQESTIRGHRKNLSPRWDSNHDPLCSRSDALTIELLRARWRARVIFVGWTYEMLSSYAKKSPLKVLQVSSPSLQISSQQVAWRMRRCYCTPLRPRTAQAILALDT